VKSSDGAGIQEEIFTLPTKGEAGGVASGTSAYYAFDQANVHFVSLDSGSQDRSPDGPMLAWLKKDLASTKQEWLIAYWHHSPYSKGSEDSDVDKKMTEMRTNALPILEEAGVDLVLAGHSHVYERSHLLDGHYGPSSTFRKSFVKDPGYGRADGDGPYRKPSESREPHRGAVYITAGSSGHTGGGPLNHPAMAVSLKALGSVVLDVKGDDLDASFVDSTGKVRDHFTILKGSKK
jgi:3',5'-cyclic AMP phosphodiesterase CpdA